MSEWVEVDCLIADRLVHLGDLQVFSSLTDMDGHYGGPTMYREWGATLGDGTDVALLRDWGAVRGGSCRHEVRARIDRTKGANDE